MTSSKLLCIVAIILAGSLPALGQTSLSLDDTFKPYGSYQGSSLDSINLQNGNQLLHAPFGPDYPQRGGKIDPRWLLWVTSHNWQAVCPANQTCYWAYGGTGVSLVHDHSVTVSRIYQIDNSGGILTYSDLNYTITTWDGATHHLSSETIDTTGYSLIMSNPDANGTPQTATIIDRNGNQYVSNGHTDTCSRSTSGVDTTTTCNETFHMMAVTDTNGNVYNLFGSGGASTPGTDTLGRTTPFANGLGSTTSDYTGCVSNSGPVTSAFVESYTGPGGVTNNIKFCYATIQLQTNFGISTIQEVQNSSGRAPTTQTQVVSIVLADGNKWAFQYDSYGELTSVTLPTGGSISYVWGAVNLTCGGKYVLRAVSSRTLNDNNGNSATWNYTWGTISNGVLTNVMTDPLGNDSVHTFTSLSGANGCDYYENITQEYEGSRNSGTLLKRVDTTYSSAFVAASDGAFLGNVVPTSIQTTVYPSGKVSLVQKV
jgi:YD repeat-containing protein